MKKRLFKLDDVTRIVDKSQLGPIKGAKVIIEHVLPDEDTFDYLVSIKEYANGAKIPVPQMEKVYEYELEPNSTGILTTHQNKSVGMRLLLMGA